MSHNEISMQSLKKVYDRVFHEASTLSKVRDAVLAEKLLDYPRDSPEVLGRSLAWKLFLIVDEPLETTSSELKSENLLNSLRSSRKRYTELLSQKMRAPDGSYPERSLVPESSSTPSPQTENPPLDLERNNPLSLHNDNPWTEWFSTLELRKTISQDVERTFPEIDFFRNTEVQDQLTNILFLHASLNPDIGYRQGMHELLAPMYYAVEVDSLPSVATDPHFSTMAELCSRVSVAADAWILFESVMRFASRWYEWREPSSAQALPSPLSNHVRFNPDGQAQFKPYIAPIVQDCNEIQSTLLRTTDPLLWKHLQSSGLEPQIYGIRWLRLLFTREFSLPDSMRLWDALFASDPTFDLVPWVSVAMLIRIRNFLIPSDYTAQLTALLRYPSPSTDESVTVHHASLLVRQASALKLSATPATGVSLVVENRNLLNIPMEVPNPAPAPRRKAPLHSRDKSSTEHTRAQSSQSHGLPETFARGLLERGESLNINKTLMNAVTELRRNLPELAASLVRSPLQSPSIPMTDERPVDERPPWEPKTRRELEREMAQLMANDKRLGHSLGWIVDILLQDEGATEDPHKLKKRKQEAIESLSYVRDVLVNGFTEIEEERLYDEEELAKRRSNARAQVGAGSTVDNGRTSSPSEMSKPAPVSVVDSHRPKTLGSVAAASLHQKPPSSAPIRTNAPLNPPWSPNSARLAPWNHTKSSFSSDGPSLPVTSLPRLPPPTSTSAFNRTATSPGNSSTSQREKPPTKPKGDPLGVL
ncbi:hypothetical protein GYMLUDRAFT_654736 [Collybiopsis luxurians FD-317 M1]|uniref:Rab-GAP TBC domain-containing protein n=1 Tax=Collybiopsis luxurians FD-317 M1 TaxID=944289 RepID=A0A0D0CMB0_9AGAR|nr:hypothetical protein GYMLUDRAFT_654736 [Collybiopsis luxurians FD-317 M1]